MQLPDIDAFVKYVGAIPAANNALGEMVQTKTGMIIFVLIMIWCIKVLGAARFIEWFGQRSRSKSAALANYLADTNDKDPLCLAAVREKLDAEHFRLATGISAGKLRRRALTALYEKVEHRLSWIGLRHASQYFKFHPDGTVTIEPRSFFDTLSYRFSQFMICLFSAGAMLLVSILLLTNDVGVRISIVLVGLPTALFMIGFAYYMTMPEYCAQKILNILAEDRNLRDMTALAEQPH